MSTEIRTIRLCREPMEEQIEGKSYFFATDYFDILIAEEKKLSDTFCSIMNLKNDTSNGEKTSAQSYTLYFSEKMHEKYETTGHIIHKGSPFVEEKGLNFLSIIQVHITPEALRKMEYEDENLCKKEKDIVLENFLDDLYDILDTYCGDNEEEKFVFRVYQVLSAGDFAVAIKSRYPETSFEISSQIRRRVVGKRGENGEIEASEWALYKTYTLLTMERDLTEIEQILERESGEGSFVIRGCYSCHYWACRDNAKVYGGEEVPEIPKGISGLNGRYDFSMNLSEESFYRVYPEIVNYKSGCSQQDDDNWKKYQKPEEQYLVFLLHKGYMSYINERYLLPTTNKKETQSVTRNVASSFVLLDENQEILQSLMDENKEYICKLSRKYQALSGHFDKILATHQNAEQYFGLLEKHIVSCFTLNQQPDTRAFVGGIGEQLDTVLESMEVYYQLYEDEDADAKEKSQIAGLIVNYMREAVHAIDNYMEHIRNNNLESLQTPNYNIESNMGMEKILIGYSEYLRKFIYYYQKEMAEKRKFYPIVVPDLHKLDICVEVLFPEGNGITWEREYEIRKNNEKSSQYLLIIDSPTLSELGDIPVFMAMLFHEIAHQFRYEAREIRNQNLKKIIVNEYMAELAAKVMAEVCVNIGDNEEKSELQEMMIQVLTETFMEWMKVYDDINVELEAPLYYFKMHFCNKVQGFVKAWNGKDEIKRRGIQYIKEIQRITDVNQESCYECLELLFEIIDQQPHKELSIEKAAFAFAWRCAYSELETSKRSMVDDDLGLIEIGKVREWCLGEKEEAFGKVWNSVRLASQGVKEESVEEIWIMFNSFAIWLENYLQKTQEDEKVKKEREAESKYEHVAEFKDMLYTRMCEEWEKRNGKYNLIGSTECDYFVKQELINRYRSWTLMGRYLGIDKNGRKDRFWEILCARSADMTTNSMKVAVSKYREITSDIFMYSVMNLSAFEYLKLVTMIISENDLYNWFNLDRIITVIVVMESISVESEEETIKLYWKVCRENFEKLYHYYCVLFSGREEKDVIEEYNRIQEKLDEKIKVGKRVSIGMFVKKISQIKEQYNNDMDSQQMLIHIEKMGKVLDRIIMDGPYYIALLRHNSKCLTDYQSGAQKLKDIRKGMEQSKDPFIKDLLELCALSTDYIRTKHYKTGVVEDLALNEKSIEFLLGMYYSRKISNTRKDRTQKE